MLFENTTSSVDRDGRYPDSTLPEIVARELDAVMTSKPLDPFQEDESVQEF